MDTYIVPETPEDQKIRRKSTRRSTIASSLAAASILRQIASTPEANISVDGDAFKKTIVSESPFSTPGQSLSKRAEGLNTTGSAKKNFHPVFTKQTKTVSTYSGVPNKRTVRTYLFFEKILPVRAY